MRDRSPPGAIRVGTALTVSRSIVESQKVATPLVAERTHYGRQPISPLPSPSGCSRTPVRLTGRAACGGRAVHRPRYECRRRP
jgi:hypothetical protein